MTLLKNDGTAPEKTEKAALTSWPERSSGGLGLSVKDGWFFGVGFGLAMTVAVPFILIGGSLIIILIITLFSSIGAW